MKKILILKDNKNSQKDIKQVMEEACKDIEIYVVYCVKDAYECVLEKSIDLFIVDVVLNMNHPGETAGLKFVERVRQIDKYEFTPVIFLSGLEDPKLYTYEQLHCYGYIEKPFSASKLKELVLQALRFPGRDVGNKTLYFRRDGLILAVERDEIIYVESLNHFLHIYMDNGDKIKIPYITLKQFAEDADCTHFIQCGRNTIVNKNHIAMIDIPNRYILLKNDFGKLEIGITYKKILKERFLNGN